jgi:proteasome lid subunit RPN8/RPN11
MVTLWITPEQIQQIIAHTQRERPNEACGLLLGAEGNVSQIIHAVNSAPNPQHRFRIDDVTLATYGHSAIGFYHSHPQGNTVPSRSDILESCYPEHVYLIIGLKRPSPEMAAWRFVQGRVERVPLHISNLPPETDELPMSSAQKAAVILSVAIGMLIVLVVAWTLLPAAPSIP